MCYRYFCKNCWQVRTSSNGLYHCSLIIRSNNVKQQRTRRARPTLHTRSLVLLSFFLLDSTFVGNHALAQTFDAQHTSLSSTVHVDHEFDSFVDCELDSVIVVVYYVVKIFYIFLRVLVSKMFQGLS